MSEEVEMSSNQLMSSEESRQEGAAAANLEESCDALTIDEMLDLHVGHCGRSQFFHFMVSSAAWMPAAFLTLMSIFTSRMPEWACTASNGCTAEDGKLQNLCSLAREDWEWVDKTASIVSEWNLICEDEWKVQLADSMFFAGFFFGAGMLGQLADIRGRWFALYASFMFSGVGAGLSVLCFGFWQFFMCKFILGFGCGGIGVASFVLSTEPLGAKSRATLGIATQYWWASGICIMSGVAAVMTKWRHFSIFIVVFTAIYCVVSAPLLKESPRWLLISGKPEKALEMLTGLAKGNKMTIPAGGLPPLKLPASTQTASIRAIFPYPALRLRLFAMGFVFVANSIVYYGLSLNVGSLGGSIYLNSFLSGLVEMPSHAFAQVSVTVVGRPRTLIFLLAIASAGCVLSAFATGATQTAVALVGRFGIAASFNMIFLYTTELFPTIVRSAALGSCSLVARIGGIAAPQIILFRRFHHSLPSLIFGATALAACFVATLLPETKGVVAEDSLEGFAKQALSDRGSRRFVQLEVNDDEGEETLPHNA